MRRILLSAVILALLVACTGRAPPRSALPSVASKSPSIAPSIPRDLAAIGVRRAGDHYEDLFAGVWASIPQGWVRYDVGQGIHAFAPSAVSLWAQGTERDPGSSAFTVTLRATQSDSFAREVENNRSSYQRDYDNAWTATRETVAGRAGFRFKHGASSRACPCGAAHLVDWGNGTTLWVEVHAGSSAMLDQYGGAADSMVQSLRTGAVDPRASTLRRFLAARIRGSGAERWLTKKAARDYKALGLYIIEPHVYDLRVIGYDVSDASRSKGGASFEVFVWGTRGADDTAAQGERLDIGPGVDLSGKLRASLVRGAFITTEPYTS